MTRWDSVLAALLCLLVVAHTAAATTSTAVLTVEGMT
jgi:hypothetical protein